MAVLQNPLIGRARKSIGAVTFSTWRGLNVGRTKPVNVRQSNSAASLLAQDKFKFASQFVSKIRTFLPLAYNFGIQKTSPFSDAVRYYRQFVKDNLEFDFPAMVGTSYGTGNTTAPSDTITLDGTTGLIVTQHDDGEDPRFFTEESTHSFIVYQVNGNVLGVYNNIAKGDEYPVSLVYKRAPTTGKEIKIAAKKVIKFKAGADLAGKVK